MKNLSLLLLFLLISDILVGQVNFTARDQVIPYTGRFRAGVNFGYYPHWSNQQMADISAGNSATNQIGVGARAIRQGLYEEVLDVFGYNIVQGDFSHFDNLNMSNGEAVAILGGPAEWHRDQTSYCPSQPNKKSRLFANLYTPVWDGGANGTPYNDNNYWAAYVYKVVTQYKNDVRFWEIWNEPGLDFGACGWRPPGDPLCNWWDRDPDPCEYELGAPIEHYVRTLRIAYEVIKTVDPDSYVCLGSMGYQAGLDAVLRNTDNPNGGSPTPEYPYGGGAYFDVVTMHTYPHFDGSTVNQGINLFQRHSDRAADGVFLFRDTYQAILNNYGFNGTQFPKKEWIVTEANAPRKAFSGSFFAGEIAQRNYLQKAFIVSKLERIGSFHVYQLFDRKTPAAASYEFDEMGMYKQVESPLVNPYNQQVNNEGIAFKTVSDLIFPTDYDAAETAKMGLTPNGPVRGYAFKRADGTFIYALWARTFTDLSEQASANYSFPAAMGLSTLNRYDWDWGYTQASSTVASTGIALNATPVFLTKSGTGAVVCSISATVNDIACSDNGTPSDPTDDTYSFDLVVSKTGDCGTGWTSSASTGSGSYGIPVSFGPFPISGGNKTLLISDNGTTAPSVSVTALAPPTCSGITPVPGNCNDNLLLNAGFEAATLDNWDAFGTVALTSGGHNSTSTALRICNDSTRLYQFRTAPTTGNYTFAVYSKSETTSATGTVAIKFLSNTFNVLAQEFRPIPATTDWIGTAVNRVAPAGSAYVEVSVIKETGSGCLLIDDACLLAGTVPPPSANIAFNNCPANITVNAAPGATSATVNYPALTVTQTGCTTAPVITLNSPASTASGSAFPIGTTSVNWVATTCNNATASCSFTVTVIATTAPTVAFTSCPSNISVTAVASATGAIVTYAAPVATGTGCPNQPILTLSSPTNTASGSAFPIGTTNVIWTATNCANQTVTCSFTVTVTEANMPTLTFVDCPSNITINAAPGANGATVNYATPTAVQTGCPNTPVVTLTSGANTGSGSNFPIGTTNVVWTATACNNLVATCSFNITVVGTINSTVSFSSCPQNLTVTAATGATGAIVTYPTPTATATGCPNAPILALSSPVGTSSGSAFPIGTTTVTWTATNCDGITATCSFTVTVQPPLPTISFNNCPTNISVIATPGANSAVVNYSALTVTQTGCPNPPIIALATPAGTASGSAFPIGTTTVTWIATTCNGVSVSCSFTITVLPTVSTNDAESDETLFVLYPNPASKLAYLSVEPWMYKPVQIRIVNQLGQSEFVRNYANLLTPAIELDLSKLSNGLYFVQITTEGKQPIVKKLVVNKR